MTLSPSGPFCSGKFWKLLRLRRESAQSRVCEKLMAFLFMPFNCAQKTISKPNCRRDDLAKRKLKERVVTKSLLLQRKLKTESCHKSQCLPCLNPLSVCPFLFQSTETEILLVEVAFDVLPVVLDSFLANSIQGQKVWITHIR